MTKLLVILVLFFSCGCGGQLEPAVLERETKTPDVPDPTSAYVDPDTDHDGVDNEHDNCPRTYNPDQADMNSDGAGDVCS